MIAICPPSLAPLIPSKSVPLKILLQVAKASGKKPSEKINRKVGKTEEERREYFREYYRKNKERKDAAQREYDRTHQDRIREYHHRRYKLKKAVAS